MKRLFQVIGFVSLICLSFFVTEKTVSVVREYDEIMIAIKEKKQSYEIAAQDATIKGNTIIPGKKGKTIDENKSYSKMKQYGSYNANLLEYKEVTPKISLHQNYDHYVIQGNASLPKVTLLFLIKGETSISEIVKILEEKQIQANFFIDSIWLEENNDTMLELIQNGYVIGNLSEESAYDNGNFAWMNTIITKVGKQKQGYCYSERDNDKALKLCAAAKNYTIRPNIILKDHITTTVKEQVSNGSILSMVPTNKNLEELAVMIQTVKNKGFEFVTLRDLLSEE